MFNAPVIVFAIIFSFLSARDIYVSKASLSQYEKDDYLLFDSFNDTLEAAHSRHPNYYPAVDAVDLGENGPILGPNFTQEVRIFTDKGRLDPDWGHIMGYTPQTLPPNDDDSDSPARTVAGKDANKEAPSIWKYEGNKIRYGFGSGDRWNYAYVDSVNPVRLPISAGIEPVN